MISKTEHDKYTRTVAEVNNSNRVGSARQNNHSAPREAKVAKFQFLSMGGQTVGHGVEIYNCFKNFDFKSINASKIDARKVSRLKKNGKYKLELDSSPPCKGVGRFLMLCILNKFEILILGFILFMMIFYNLLFFMEWADGAARRRRRLAD